jgi:cytidine deaminase
MDWDPLVETASKARLRAYVPYSHFAVGAAILAADGTVYSGCNIENRSFGLTLCAERVAIGSAVADGTTKIQAVAVITELDPPSPPCGLCREALTEFCHPDLPILLTNTAGARIEYRLADLLPHPFEFPPG